MRRALSVFGVAVLVGCASETYLVRLENLAPGVANRIATLSERETAQITLLSGGLADG